MPIWPFRKRRRSTPKDPATQPLTEKEVPQPPQKAATYPVATSTPPVTTPPTTSKERRQSTRPTSQVENPFADNEKAPASSGKENVPPPPAQRSSREDITALPMSKRLEHSPHLRPADMQRPPIPYNFRPYSSSQTSVQRNNGVATSPAPNVLRKRRSEYDTSSPHRRRSSRRRRDDHLREEEIRAMSAHVPIPKRSGGFKDDGPLRRDSKRTRGPGMQESNVSLPPEESLRSTISGIMEQRGWEIGSIDVFNPRPAVRLSGIPQYVTPSSFGSPPTSPTIEQQRAKVREAKDKRPETKDRARKRDTIGTRADEFDASELRLLLERDTKRRERRKKEQNEKLDKKLRGRSGRNRGDSDKSKKRREGEEERRAEEAKLRAEEENRSRNLITPPTAIHPALRNTPTASPTAEHGQEAVGLGIGAAAAKEVAVDSNEQTREVAAETTSPEDPFADPTTEEVATPPAHEKLPGLPGAFTPLESPMEDVVVGTAQEVRMSQASTPPLSPVAPPTRSPLYQTQTQTATSPIADARRTSELSPPPPITEPRRASEPEPKQERRMGAWASIFRRGGTNGRKPTETAPSEASFSNTSRESMRNQPLPPHLIDTSVPQVRRKSGTPVRTQSKFREDLPEMPLSPPDSRLASPEASTPAAAYRAKRASVPVDIPRYGSLAEPDREVAGRSDTPVSPSLRGQHMMSASLASVDSEGSWLASGSAKRHSTQSRLSQLGQRRPEASGSYEELGGDKDAEYFRRSLHARKQSGSALAGASPDEENELDETIEEPETPGDPLTVHESVRRQPTLVHGNPRMKSREGLLAEFSGDPETPGPDSAGTGKGSMDLSGFDSESPEEPQILRATSVGHGKGHARQMSAGSVKVLDVPPRRPSMDARGESGEPPSVNTQTQTTT